MIDTYSVVFHEKKKTMNNAITEAYGFVYLLKSQHFFINVAQRDLDFEAEKDYLRSDSLYRVQSWIIK